MRFSRRGASIPYKTHFDHLLSCDTFPPMRLPLPRPKRVPKGYLVTPIDVPAIFGADMAAVYHGERRGGDVYDFIRVAPHLILFALLDVAGRKRQNRPIVAAAQRTFREAGHRLFSRDDINEAESMVELSLEINRTIIDEAQVCSCPGFVGCYNETVGTVCYSNAGHTPALLRDHSGITELPATGLPLGLFSHVTQDAPTVALPPGAVLLLVSRGVTEAKHGRQEYGLERVSQTLKDSAAQNAEQLCSDILNAVEQFTHKPPTHNDVTALALVRSASAMTATISG
jgi:serine phosphatase RsbU (regulator of sigma subunit)